MLTWAHLSPKPFPCVFTFSLPLYTCFVAASWCTSRHTLDTSSIKACNLWYLVAAGYYPSILRVEHPAVRYQAVQGGTQEVDAQPSELRFMDKHKGVFLDFYSSWLISIIVNASTSLPQCGIASGQGGQIEWILQCLVACLSPTQKDLHMTVAM